MKRKKNLPGLAKPLVLAAVIALAGSAPLSAELVGSSEWGYALDLPEGYALADKSGTDRYHFSHELFPAELQIALYPYDRFTGAEGALHYVTGQLKSTGTEVAFSWRRRSAAIGKLDAGTVAGWSLALELAGKKGWMVLAVYSDADRATELEPLMISTIDSVFTDDGSYFEPGPMTAFAWAPEKDIQQTFSDGKRTVPVPFNSVDADGNQSVVDREFSLLTSYLETDRVIPAWQRYYRMIYRDAWARLSKPTFIVGASYPAEPRKLAESLLSWTQDFEYGRDFNGADFTNLPEAFVSRKGDCDTRALLMVLMLNQLGVDAVLLVSPEYSHAVAAVDCAGAGARFTVGDKNYLICDTTARVAPGLIAQDMADPSKWFAVTFYAFPRSGK